MLNTLFTLPVRVFARGILITHGAQNLSSLVRKMGLDPVNHKGTIHAVLVTMEKQGILAATINPKTGKRNKWFIRPTAIRNRDRLAALIF